MHRNSLIWSALCGAQYKLFHTKSMISYTKASPKILMEIRQEEMAIHCPRADVDSWENPSKAKEYSQKFSVHRNCSKSKCWHSYAVFLNIGIGTQIFIKLEVTRLSRKSHTRTASWFGLPKFCSQLYTQKRQQLDPRSQSLRTEWCCTRNAGLLDWSHKWNHRHSIL